MIMHGGNNLQGHLPTWLCVSFYRLTYRYEGLTQVNVPHNKGVMVFGSGTGAGLQSVNPYDK